MGSGGSISRRTLSEDEEREELEAQLGIIHALGDGVACSMVHGSLGISPTKNPPKIVLDCYPSSSIFLSWMEAIAIRNE